jgi:pyruvate/2-oxoglutarate dehydrogenase complex dihydrolipoamide dehydrogenase (E3) component
MDDWRIAIIERGVFGGTCLNVGCIPSKMLIYAADVADTIRHASKYGVHGTFDGADWPAIRDRVFNRIDPIAQGGREYRHSLDHVTVFEGDARFVAERTFAVNGVRVRGEQVVIAAGARPFLPEIPGLTDGPFHTSDTVMRVDRLPEHLIVLGGGYVGVEFAQAFCRFGSRVTVVEFGRQLMAREDPDVAEAVRAIFEDDGIDVVLGAETRAVEGRSGDRVHFHVRTAAGERVIDGSDVLVAAGRTPNTRGIGLGLAGVEFGPHGYVTVNERLETTALGIWAMGECAGSPQFTHAAFDDFRVVRDNLAGGKRTTHGRLVPYCVFIDPELARVGLNESEARQKRMDVRVVTLPMASVLRARSLGEMRGFMKALLDTHSDRILGFTMLGPEAGEVGAVVQTAMLAGLPYTGLRDAIFTHPTMAEGLNVLFANVPAARRQGNHDV